jgi:hypothetical protein
VKWSQAVLSGVDLSNLDLDADALVDTVVNDVIFDYDLMSQSFPLEKASSISSVLG